MRILLPSRNSGSSPAYKVQALSVPFNILVAHTGRTGYTLRP